MGMKMDPQHAAYREFRIQLLASQKTGNKNPFTAFIADPSNVSIASARGGAPTVAMRCGKCRTLLFRGRCRIPHAPKPNCAMTYHIEPMAWIPGLDGGKLADKIVCPTPKCGAKLGAWTWGAESCTCGTMTTPSFAIQTRKVDTTIIPSDQAVRKSVIQAQ
ncbi:tyrosine protein phosphatase yvh1, partial [Thoreauomyces humboldtii]